MRLNCGDTCPKSGSYKVIDVKGNVINSIWVGEGETMPPTQYSDCHYESEPINIRIYNKNRRKLRFFRGEKAFFIAKVGTKLGLKQIIEFFHFFNLVLFILFQVRINKRGGGAVGCVTNPKAYKFALNTAFLTACHKSVTKVVRVVVREKVFYMLSKHCRRKLLDFIKINM